MKISSRNELIYLFLTIVILIIFGIGAIYTSDLNSKTDLLISKFGVDDKILLLEKENEKLKIELAQKDIFYRLLQKIDPAYYNRRNNNCYIQSQRLQKELLANGIKSSIIINEDRSHAWLAVWIESTNGSFKILSREQNILEIRDNDLAVICN